MINLLRNNWKNNLDKFYTNKFWRLHLTDGLKRNLEGVRNESLFSMEMRTITERQR